MQYVLCNMHHILCIFPEDYASAAGPSFIHWWQIGWRRGLLMHVSMGIYAFMCDFVRSMGLIWGLWKVFFGGSGGLGREVGG